MDRKEIINFTRLALRNAKQMLDAAMPEIQSYLADESIPQNDRWGTFDSLKEYLPVETYGDGHLDALAPNLNLYDDFYVERYETVTYQDMLGKILSAKRFTDDQIKNWCAEVLRHGHGSFKYDW